MTKHYTELTVNAQTAYAQLLEVALSTEHFRSIADLPGSFSSKVVKGHRYWYFQYTEPSGKLKQVFVGLDSEAVMGRCLTYTRYRLCSCGKEHVAGFTFQHGFDTHDAINSLEMGLLPISGLSNKTGASNLSPKDSSLRLDFLTTLHRDHEEPYQHPKLNVSLQPLKFMEFSLEQVQQAVMFNQEDAAVVNIPHPARYALHKLMVFGEREGAFVAKSSKDLLQAAWLHAERLQRKPPKNFNANPSYQSASLSPRIPHVWLPRRY